MKISKIYDGKIHGHPLFILSKMLVAFTIVVALTACGGSNTDDGDEAVLKTGVFIDFEWGFSVLLNAFALFTNFLK